MSKLKSVYGLLVFMGFCLGFSFAENVNTLSMVPTTYTGKYFCPVDFSVMANYNGGEGFTNCQYVLSGGSSVSFSYVSRGADYSFTDKSNVVGNLLFVEEKNEKPITGNAVCSNLTVVVEDTNSPVANIKFVNASGNLPTENDFLNTYDLLNLAYNGEDTLTGVEDMTINLYACPCVVDDEAPIITSWSHNFGANNHYTGSQTISFVTYDKGGSAWGYWTHGYNLGGLLSSGTLGQYYNSSSVPGGMDNQEGVSRQSISVKIIDENGVESIINSLNITEYEGTSQIPQYTWDGNYRGYRVSFDTDSFGIENPVTVVVSVSDNILSIGGECETSSHTTVFTGEFNSKEAPTITLDYPTGENINPNVGVELIVADSRAGVDTGSVVFEILPIMSGGQVIMSGSIYSGSDLHFQLIDGSAELGGASKYRVSFQPIYDFAVSSTITISGYAKDYVEMETHQTFTFSTRADCTFYGCVNFVDIFSETRDNLIQGQFTGSLIVVTGTLAQYPYLTGENNDIVMCGPIDETINLAGNIDIYSGEDVVNGQAYPYEDLYITGLDFTYESGVIVPIYN